MGVVVPHRCISINIVDVALPLLYSIAVTSNLSVEYLAGVPPNLSVLYRYLITVGVPHSCRRTLNISR
jgi:hypothetical protein